jgi:glycerol uptake facilitator-like aquaporin
LVEVIRYFFAAYAPPVIANTNANPAITVAGLTRKRLRIAENIGYLSS